MKIIKIAFLLLLISFSRAQQFHNLAEKIMSSVNSDPKSTWIAGHQDWLKGMSILQIKNLVNSIFEVENPNIDTKQSEQKQPKIPVQWFAQEQWPLCLSITEIRDQSNCASSYAVGPTSVISDRICIHSNQTLQTRISSGDVISCCAYCGAGCNGGYPSQVYRYWINRGIVSGGLYEQDNYCKSYPFPPCKHGKHTPYGICDNQFHQQAPTCLRQCNKDYDKSYNEDKNYGKKFYKVGKNVEDIQLELMENGPVSATIVVYEDFFTYKSGVYQHSSTQVMGAAILKIVGWGIENGTPYWLVANSYNSEWGDNGFIKILRGSDECGIESHILAGLPDFDRQNQK